MSRGEGMGRMQSLCVQFLAGEVPECCYGSEIRKAACISPFGDAFSSDKW